MSGDAREILRELLAEALAGTNGHAVAPPVPPPPVAAVHRPATWEPPEHKGGSHLYEAVVIGGDDDLNRFVRDLLTRDDREAIRAGRVKFTLGEAAPSGSVRVERGAVTERKVAEAAKAGGRLVLGRGAVLTPLAREKARALGIEIEREW